MRPVRPGLGTDLSSVVEQEIDTLAHRVLALARERGGQLVAVTVTRPPNLGAGELARVLEARLALLGLTLVEIETDAAAGPLRLVSAEFKR